MSRTPEYSRETIPQPKTPANERGFCEAEDCDNSLEGKKAHARFCSRRCQTRHWRKYGHTGGSKISDIGNKTYLADGYVNIFTKDGYIPEHRVVMEKMLGRPMQKGESVHHRNGIRSDNREENLELWVRGHTPGNRGKEIICPHCGKAYSEV